HTFNFVTNLPSNATANTHILVATSGFGALAGGVTPDYVIPANFFATGYGTVPTDGVHSLLQNGSTEVNSPTNFAGNAGSVNLAAAVPMLPRWGILLL